MKEYFYINLVYLMIIVVGFVGLKEKIFSGLVFKEVLVKYMEEYGLV